MARPKYPSDDVDKLLLRFPEGLRDQLKAVADANGRSLNAEIVQRLQGSLDDAKDDQFGMIFASMTTLMDTLDRQRIEFHRQSDYLREILKANGIPDPYGGA